jgi:hypothetical protein
MSRHSERCIPQALQDPANYRTLIYGALGQRLVFIDVERLAGI